MESLFILSPSNTQVGKKKRTRKEHYNRAQKCSKGLNQGEKNMSVFIRNECGYCWKKGAFTLTKNKGNSVYPTRQYAMGNHRIYLTDITKVEIKLQNGTLNQEVCNVWWFQRLQMSSRVHREHQERYSGVQCEDWNVLNKKLLVFNVHYVEENYKYLKH